MDRLEDGPTIAIEVQTRDQSVSRLKRARYFLVAMAVAALGRVVVWLPHRAVRRLGSVAGWLGYFLLRHERRVARANLELAFGAGKSRPEKARIARASMQTFAATMLGLLWAPRLSREALDDLVEVDVEGLALVREIRASGRGIIFVTPHYGDWELLGLATGFLGIPVTIIAERMRNQRLEEFLARRRAVSGNRILPNRGSALALFKALKRGECTALLMDLTATRRHGGVWLRFFGVPVFTYAAAGALALHTGAAIIGAVARPLPDGRMRLCYGPEIPCPSTGDFNTDLVAANQRCLDFCEQVIREMPEPWLWTYKRWKFRPAGDTGPYPDYARPVRF